MAKMPEKLKIFIGDGYGDNKTDVTDLVKEGDEISITTGEQRSRPTNYKVIHAWSNCMEIRRENVILDEKRQELRKDLEKREVMKKLSAADLKAGLQDGGHPKALINPESGETWRHEYLEECSRRGEDLLKELGWPTALNAKYFNLHTGGIETLKQELDGFRDITGKHRPHEKNDQWGKVWGVIEHWLPAVDENYQEFVQARTSYLETEKARAEGRSKKQIREKQEKIQREIDNIKSCKTFNECFKYVGVRS